jgi:hypothetical protein
LPHTARLRLLPLAAATTALVACAAASPQVPTPEAWLGRPVGADFTLADWSEVSGYYAQLAQTSPRVRLERVGESTEGRDYLLAVISSEANLARLDELKACAAALADPRGKSEQELERALERGRPFVMISIAMHSNEVAAPQFGLELAWKLATSDEEPYASARDSAVVLLLPCTNPDGLERVVSWYRATVGTPHEAAGMTELYQRYAGHDNNRDWFMLSLAETRLVSRLLYRDWHPQVYWDVHQQGQRGERMFVPPFRDPLNPNLDPGLIAGIGALGTRALLDMTREGLSGVATGVRFDMWWNGGNRNVPVRHNLVGLLTEAASAELASPIFLRPDELRAPGGGDYAPSNGFPDPWPGGWWRLRDIIDYEHGFARSLLRSVASEPRTWLELRLEATRRAIREGAESAPRAWVLPSVDQDVGAVRRLAESLLGTGVELSVAREAFTADEREFPAGSIVVRQDQPYGPYVKDLFEVQRYPGDLPPYDVAGWTLPLLLGVERAEILRGFEAELAPAASAAEAVAGFELAAADAGWPIDQSDTWPAVFAELGAGRPVTLHGGAFRAGAHEDLEGARVLRKLPRVGLYAPWSGNMSEGWLRWTCEYAGLPFVTVRNEALRAGRLAEVCDVLVLPDVSQGTLDEGRAPGSVPHELASGLDPEGAIAVEEFVRMGGTLVAMEGSAAWAIELFGVPLVDLARGDEAGEFSCPGSLLRAIPESSPFTEGLPPSIALFFEGSAAWKPSSGEGAAPETLLTYDRARLLLSGWIREGERIEGASAWVRARHGEGALHLFGFSPHYRSWTQQTFPLLWRALLLDGAQ